jgi:23S rRNA pseudouridine1911/1915/1917 synthase
MPTFGIGAAEADSRVDVALSALAGITRSQARRWIDAGRVRINERICRASARVALGDALDALPPDPLPSPLTPEAIPIDVLFEDENLIVIDKAAGMVVHPAPGHGAGTLVNALLHHCSDLAGIGGVLRPGIVHRLDRGTSGVLVAAKNDQTHTALSDQFRDHSIERIYLALVRGSPAADSGRVDRPIGRHRTDRKRISVQSPVAREAHTAWRVLERYPSAVATHPGYAWLEITPETGRTHQIRVHLSATGLPIVGDPVYGRNVRERMERPALHASVLGFVHPGRAEFMRFEAPLPADLVAVLAELKTSGRIS